MSVVLNKQMNICEQVSVNLHQQDNNCSPMPVKPETAVAVAMLTKPHGRGLEGFISCLTYS